MPKYHNILNAAIQTVVQGTGLHLWVEQEHSQVEGQPVDAVLKVEGISEEFAAEVKKWAPNANLEALIYQINRLSK